MKKERKAPLDICLSALFLRCGRERSTKRGAIECKVLVFSLTFLQAQPTPDPLRRDQQKPASDQKVSYQKPCHKKKAVMVAKDVAAVLVFLLGSFYCSPVYWGCMVSEGNALSGLPCRSGIWSWWLCDSLGWGIAVSAEQVTRSWSMGLFRQAYVQRSYGMVPLRCSKAPLPTFPLVNNNSSLFSFGAKKHKMATHTYGIGKWPVSCSKRTTEG